MKKIAVIGGGITGLAAAQRFQELKDAGGDFEIVLFEKSDRLGGIIESEQRDGFLIEGGPDCFVSEKPWAVEMSRKVGVDDRLLCTNEAEKGTFIFSKGRLHPLPEGLMLMVPTSFVPFATSSLFSWPGKLRMGLELFIPRRKDGDSDESLSSFVVRRLGREALDKIAEPLVAGIHGADPETMSLKSSFPRFLQMEQKYGSLIKGMLAAKKITASKEIVEGSEPKLTFFTSFEGCMTDLSDGVAKRLTDIVIRLNSEVKSVHKKTGSGFNLFLEGMDPEYFDSIVITSPAYSAGKILESVDREISATLNAIPYTTSATISLAYDSAKLTVRPKGFGFVVPQIENRKILAATFSSIKWANRAPNGKLLVRCFVGGARGAQKLVDLDDRELEKIASEELKVIAGIDSKPEFSKIFRWYRSMPQYTVGHLDRVDAMMKSLEENHPGLFVTGAAFYGVGVGDCIHNGWVAADKAIDFINQKKSDESYEQSEDLIGDV